jgi:small subunit ribosomal protein S2e
MGGDGGFGGKGFGDKGKGGKKGKGKKGKGKKGGKKGGGDKEWVPTTKLGRLVKEGKIKDIETIYLHSLPIKEYQIVDELLAGAKLSDEVMKIHPVQKMSSAGQTNRFVAYVLVGDSNGHIGLGSKCSKEVATSIRGAIISAKLNLIPVRRGYWGNKLGAPHTMPMKVHGKCGSVSVRLIPAPRGTGVVGSPTLKKMMHLAGVNDVFSCSCGHTRTKGNFMKACFEALRKSYCFLTPDLWKQTEFVANPYQEHTDFLAQDPSKQVKVE